MRTVYIATLLIGTLTVSHVANAATNINVNYDDVETTLRENQSNARHGKMGFTLVGSEVYINNNGNILFHAPLNQYVQMAKANGQPYNVKFSLGHNSITRFDTFRGYIIEYRIRISGENCSSAVGFRKLPGERSMISSNSEPFKVSDIHNVTCVIDTSNWQPPQ